MHTLRHEVCQLVVVLPGLMEEGGEEGEAGKRLDSINLMKGEQGRDGGREGGSAKLSTV